MLIENHDRESAGDERHVRHTPKRGDQRLTISVEEASRLLGISRGLAYMLVNRGDIPSVRLGRRIVVPRRALDRLLDPPMTLPEPRPLIQHAVLGMTVRFGPA